MSAAIVDGAEAPLAVPSHLGLYAPNRQNRQNPAVLKRVNRTPPPGVVLHTGEIPDRTAVPEGTPRSLSLVAKSSVPSAETGSRESLCHPVVVAAPDIPRGTRVARGSILKRPQVVEKPAQPYFLDERRSTHYSSAACCPKLGDRGNDDAVPRLPSKSRTIGAGGEKVPRSSLEGSTGSHLLNSAQPVAPFPGLTSTLSPGQAPLSQSRLNSIVRESPLYQNQEAAERLAAQLLPLELQRANRRFVCGGCGESLYRQGRRAASSLSSIQPAVRSNGSPPRPRHRDRSRRCSSHEGRHLKSRYRRQRPSSTTLTSSTSRARSSSSRVSAALNESAADPCGPIGGLVRHRGTQYSRHVSIDRSSHHSPRRPSRMQPRFPKPPHPPRLHSTGHISAFTDQLKRVASAETESIGANPTNDDAAAAADGESTLTSATDSASSTTASCSDDDRSSSSSESEAGELCGSSRHRYGPAALPEFLQTRNPRFADSSPSPYSYYYYDETAPNEVLLANDVYPSRPCKLAKRYIKHVIKCKRGKSQLYEVTGSRYDPQVEGSSSRTQVPRIAVDEESSDADSQVLRRISRQERHLSVASHGSSVFTSSAFTSLAPFEAAPRVSERRGNGWLGCCGGGWRRTKTAPIHARITAQFESPKDHYQAVMRQSPAVQFAEGAHPQALTSPTSPLNAVTLLPTPTASGSPTAAPDLSGGAPVQFHLSPLARNPASLHSMEASRAWMGDDKSSDTSRHVEQRRRKHLNGQREKVVSRFSLLPGPMAYQRVDGDYTMLPQEAIGSTRQIRRSPLADDALSSHALGSVVRHAATSNAQLPGSQRRRSLFSSDHLTSNRRVSGSRRTHRGAVVLRAPSSSIDSGSESDEERDNVRQVELTKRRHLRRVARHISAGSESTCDCACCRAGWCSNEKAPREKTLHGADPGGVPAGACSVSPSESISCAASRQSRRRATRSTQVVNREQEDADVPSVSRRSAPRPDSNAPQTDVESIYCYTRPSKPERYRNLTYRVRKLYFDGESGSNSTGPADTANKFLPQYSVSYRQYPTMYFDVIEPSNNREFFRVRNAPGFYR